MRYGTRVVGVIALLLAGAGADSTGQKPGAADGIVTAGGLIHVAGLRGTGADGRLVGDDVASQTRRVLDRLSGVLTGAGSSLSQAVSLSVYLRNPEDFEAMNAAYAAYFSDSPPVRTTIVADLLEEALVEISAIAVPEGARREVLHPAGWAALSRPYSYIVRTDDLVFLAGLVSRRGRDDTLVPGTMPVQAKTVLDNAATLLKTAGLGLQDVVLSRVSITDDVLFDQMNDVYRTAFTTEPPARAMSVSRLMGRDYFLEMTLTATQGEREVIGPVVAPSLPLSAAVAAGPRVFVSGVLGDTDDNRYDVAAQTRESMTRIDRTLTLAGLSWADVVESTVYLTDLSDYRAMRDVFDRFSPVARPAVTVVGTKLVSRNARVAITVTAAR